MSELFLILSIVAFVFLLIHLSVVKELALQAAKKHCHEMEVQFLDGTVSPSGFGFTRNRKGTLTLVQKFRFEFTVTGGERYRGATEFASKQMLKVVLEPHKI
ncbi:DUF3301 domain-containing protein [Aurantivibrio infirmus]